MSERTEERLDGFTQQPKACSTIGRRRLGRDPRSVASRAFEPTVDRPQASAETRPSLLREFGLVGPFAFLNVSPEAKRGLGPQRRRLVERKMHGKRSARSRPVARPQPVPVSPVSKQQMNAVPTVAQGRLAGPGGRPERQN